MLMPSWSMTEADHLQDLLEASPWPMVPNAYNEWATANGYPARSRKGLYDKLARMGIDRNNYGAYICIGTLARLLGRWPTVVNAWLEAGRLRAFKTTDGRPRVYIERQSLLELLQSDPKRFRGIKLAELQEVTQDMGLARELLATGNYNGMRTVAKARQVRDKKTGTVYSSVKAAARAVGVPYTTMRGLLESDCRYYAGRVWELCP